mmetsp:Transcript_4197/g.10623  ORF Transcript_4197/g.10623 Transcript_4197/m.10623 type:complete len:89 (-) Transcript_4197:27-293(-)
MRSALADKKVTIGFILQQLEGVARLNLPGKPRVSLMGHDSTEPVVSRIGRNGKLCCPTPVRDDEARVPLCVCVHVRTTHSPTAVSGMP